MSAATPSRPPVEPPSDSGDRLLYWIIGATVVLLMVVGLLTYSSHESTEEAQAKAAELTQKFEQADLPVPEDQDILIRTLGDDGGAVCDNPADALGRAILLDQISNGASFVGRRPVIIDRRALLGQALIMETYCPDELATFRENFDDLKFDDVIKN